MNSHSSNNSRRGANRMGLNGVAVIQHYVDNILDSVSGMKVLLLDADTTQIVSAVRSQTEILERHVYLVRSLSSDSNSNNSNTSPTKLSSSDTRGTSHLAAVVLVRPTPTNVQSLCSELRNPRYASYRLYFTARLDTGLLRQLAEADGPTERVTHVAQHYADFLPLEEALWSLQLPRNATLPMTLSAGTAWAPQFAVPYERHVQGVWSVLQATSVFRRGRGGTANAGVTIRYARASACANELAHDIHDRMLQEEGTQSQNNTSHGSGKSGGTLLLILDRRDDPVTPLLSQWTYQAMVHELLGLNNHRVVLKGAPGVTKDLDEVVLSAASDEFYATHRHSNFGELGEAVQRMLQEYQTQTAQHSAENLNSIQDMQQFMDKYPELRSRSHIVSKHVAILGELARLVGNYGLMDVSQFEQALACHDDPSNHWRELREKLSSGTIQVADKLRLGLLYAMRYETTGNLHLLQQAMAQGGVSAEAVALVPALLRYGGRGARGPGLYHTGSGSGGSGGMGGGGGDGSDVFFSRVKSMVGAVQGVDNIYAQHVPLVMDTIQSAMRGKLSPRDYPATSSTSSVTAPDEMIVFMVGGVTYEEGTKVAEYNATLAAKQQPSSTAAAAIRPKVVLCGSTVHNSTSFLDELKATTINQN